MRWTAHNQFGARADSPEAKRAGVATGSFVQPLRSMNSGPAYDPRAEPGSPAFPATLWTVVLQARSEDPTRASAALHQLCERYDRAIHAWFQRSRPASVSPARAEEWAQDFFVFMHEKNPFRKIEHRDSRFRSFLVSCLKNFLKDKLDAELAAKRGGGAAHLDIEDANVSATAEHLHEILDRELARALHARVLAQIKSAWANKGHGARYDALQPHILGVQPDTSYESLGTSLGLTANHVKKVVFDLREAYYDFFRAEVGQLVNDPALLDDEMRYLAGLLAGGAV